MDRKEIAANIGGILTASNVGEKVIKSAVLVEHLLDHRKKRQKTDSGKSQVMNT